jgi:hypothetical protein
LIDNRSLDRRQDGIILELWLEPSNKYNDVFKWEKTGTALILLVSLLRLANFMYLVHHKADRFVILLVCVG